MPLSDYDRANIRAILYNEKYDWFTARLMRLIAHADDNNRIRLAKCFPEEVALVMCNRQGDRLQDVYECTDCGSHAMSHLLVHDVPSSKDVLVVHLCRNCGTSCRTWIGERIDVFSNIDVTPIRVDTG